jgi:hypothetical protein
MPHALELLAEAMRDLGEACVSASRTREATSAGQALSMLVDYATPSPPSFIHLTLGPDLPVGFTELTAALERHRGRQLVITSSIDETFPGGEILVGVLTATPRGAVA